MRDPISLRVLRPLLEKHSGGQRAKDRRTISQQDWGDAPAHILHRLQAAIRPFTRQKRGDRISQPSVPQPRHSGSRRRQAILWIYFRILHSNKERNRREIFPLGLHRQHLWKERMLQDIDRQAQRREQRNLFLATEPQRSYSEVKHWGRQRTELQTCKPSGDTSAIRLLSREDEGRHVVKKCLRKPFPREDPFRAQQDTS